MSNNQSLFCGTKYRALLCLKRFATTIIVLYFVFFYVLHPRLPVYLYGKRDVKKNVGASIIFLLTFCFDFY